MNRAGVKRLVVLSAAAHFPGLLNRIASFIMRNHMRDSLAMEAIVQASGLDWTIARPPRLTQEDYITYRTRENAAARMGFSVSRTAEINGQQMHYLYAGHGPAVLLLHGFAETSRMWRPLIPLLAEKFTVIAPDLPAIGDSSIPRDKIDMITSANRIHALVHSLGIEKARVV